MTRLALLLLALQAFAWPAASRAQDFVDTRLTFTFGDDDVLAETGEQLPISPLPGFGDRPSYQLFYDNLNTRFSSRETITHLVIYKRMPAFIEDVTTEAALVVRLDLANTSLSDTGSYIRLAYNPWDDAPTDGLSLTLFPFDSERFRLGYLFALSFGGAEFIPRRSLVRAPGLRLQLDRGIAYAFIGMKTIPVRTPLTVSIESGGDTEIEVVRVDETQYSVLGGAGLDLADDRLRVEVGIGYFQQGELDLPSYPSAPVYSIGAAARVAWHDNLGVPESIDFQLYRNDPNEPFVAFRPVEYVPGQLGYLIAAEGVWIRQHLADVDETNATDFEDAFAGAIRGQLRYGYLRMELTALFRDLSFLLKNVPSFVPFLTIPDTATVNPEFFIAGSFDYHFPRPRITIGASAGLQFPATFSVPFEFGSAQASRTLVIRQEGRFEILPLGTDAVPIFGARVHVRIDLSEMLYSLAWIQYTHDENKSRLVVSATEGTRRVFQASDQLGFGVSVAARF